MFRSILDFPGLFVGKGLQWTNRQTDGQDKQCRLLGVEGWKITCFNNCGKFFWRGGGGLAGNICEKLKK